MLDLKFFYIVEINLKHPALSNIPLVKDFSSQSWLTVSSIPYEDDKLCLEASMKLMKDKAKKIIKNGTLTTFNYAENPLLHCKESEILLVDDEGFDENVLVSMTLTDNLNEVMMKSMVMVYGLDSDVIPGPLTNRNIH